MAKPGTMVVVAPHPDDEWIGCGCTMLKRISEKKKLKVLVITRQERTENRIAVSKKLAKEYGYGIAIMDNVERKIDAKRLAAFLKKHIANRDSVYIPDMDTHPDHRLISATCQDIFPKRQLRQYCVYNNSLNPVIRVLHMFLSLVTGKGFPSFRQGYADGNILYNLPEKNRNIRKFGEYPRDADVWRSP